MLSVTSIANPLHWNSIFDILCVLLASTPTSTDPFGAAIPMQPTGLKSDDFSLGIPPAWPGQGYGNFVYLQDS